MHNQFAWLKLYIIGDQLLQSFCEVSVHGQQIIINFVEKLEITLAVTEWLQVVEECLFYEVFALVVEDGLKNKLLITLHEHLLLDQINVVELFAPVLY